MKRLIISCLLLAASCSLTVTAQNRSIEFAPETVTMEEMFATAAQQGKLIFMDCYASWCGPCKQMAQEVFTQDDVADFFNENFYCAKYDMEKGEGLRLNEKYGVGAYPTFLFIDPETTFIVYTSIGGRPAEQFIAEGRKALDPNRSVDQAKSAYEAGDRSVQTVKDYLSILYNARLSGVMNEVANEFLSGKSAEELAESDNWSVFAMGIDDIDNEASKMVLSDKQFFYDNIGKDIVDRKIASLISTATRPFTHSKSVGGDTEFDKAEYDRIKAIVENSGVPSAPSILLQMKATEADSRGDVKGIIACLNEYMKTGVISEMDSQYFVASNVARLTQAKTKSMRKKALKTMDNLFKFGKNDLDRANALRMKGIILNFYGMTAESEAAMEESMMYARKNAESYNR